MVRILKATLLSAMLAFSASCSKDKGDKDSKSDRKVEQFNEAYRDSMRLLDSKLIAVTDEAGAPLANAQVLIGIGNNQPFANNFLTTDENGILPAPAAWTDALPVTIAVDGYVRATYFEQQANGQIFKLKKMETQEQFEILGNATEFQIKNSDGIADFGMILPALDRKTIFNFNVSTVISSRMDKTEIAGRDLEMPSNVTFPKQKESYFIPITLNKPSYRIYFRNKGPQMVFAARGQFPFKKMVDEVREGNKHFSELINLFRIQGGSLRMLDVQNTSTRVDLPVNELTFTQKLTMKSPQYAKTEYLLAAAVSEYQGYMFPTDVKAVASGQSQGLAVAQSADPQNKSRLLAVLQKKGKENEDSSKLPISAALVDFNDNTQPEMIAVPEAPTAATLTQISLKETTSPASIAHIGSYAALSKVSTIQSGKETVDINTKVWEAYYPGWVSEVKLPEWPTGFELAGKKKWEIALIGSNQNAITHVGPGVYDTATHATYSAVEFQ